MSPNVILSRRQDNLTKVHLNTNRILQRDNSLRLTSTKLVSLQRRLANAHSLQVDRRAISNISKTNETSDVVRRLISLIGNIVLNPDTSSLARHNIVHRTVLSLGGTKINLRFQLLRRVTRRTMRLIITYNSSRVTILNQRGVVQMNKLMPITSTLQSATHKLMSRNSIFRHKDRQIRRHRVGFFTRAHFLLISRHHRGTSNRIRTTGSVTRKHTSANHQTVKPTNNTRRTTRNLTCSIVTHALTMETNITRAKRHAVSSTKISLLRSIVTRTRFFRHTKTMILSSSINLLSRFLRSLLTLEILRIRNTTRLTTVRIHVVGAIIISRKARLTNVIATLKVFRLSSHDARVHRSRTTMKADRGANRIRGSRTVRGAFTRGERLIVFRFSSM